MQWRVFGDILYITYAHLLCCKQHVLTIPTIAYEVSARLRSYHIAFQIAEVH